MEKKSIRNSGVIILSIIFVLLFCMAQGDTAAEQPESEMRMRALSLTAGSHQELITAIEAIRSDSEKTGIITLTDDFTLAGGVYINADIDVTIQGDYCVSALNERHFNVYGILRLKDGTYDGGGTAGGIYVQKEGSLICTDIVVSNCFAVDYGGGIYGYQESAVSIKGSRIENNYAGIAGGGIRAFYADLKVEDSVIISNTSERGGGLSVNTYENGSAEILNSQLCKNTASAHGAAVYVSESPNNVLFENCTIDNNDSEGNGAGFLINQNSKATIKECRFYSNLSKGAGTLEIEASQIFLINTDIYQNKVLYYGGAMRCIYQSEVQISGGSICENEAVLEGGGIYLGAESVLKQDQDAGSGVIKITDKELRILHQTRLCRFRYRT